MKLSVREYDTILAALRYWQRMTERYEAFGPNEELLNMACENGAALSLEEIDSLCERINS